MPSISTTGQLANISQEMMAKIRFTNEHNAPMVQLVESHMLKKGHDTEIIPKVGQMNVRILNEGEEMTDEEDLGLTTISVSTNEVGGYILLSRKLLRRTAASTGNLFSAAGRQFGEAQARLMNTDILALFTALNGGTDFGSNGIPFSAANATSAVARAKTGKFGGDLFMVHHPNAVMRLARDLSTIGSGQIRPLPAGYSADLLSKVWKGLMVWDVPVFETGDMDRDGSDDAIGVIADKSAIGVLREMAPTSDKDWVANRRSWQLTFVSEYIAFEIDDTKGAPITCDAADPTLA